MISITCLPTSLYYEGRELLVGDMSNVECQILDRVWLGRVLKLEA